MSQLQVIIEERPEDNRLLKRHTLGVVLADPEIESKECNKVNSSTSSHDSFPEPSLDTETKKIQLITENLEKKIASKIKAFKQYSQSYIEINRAFDKAANEVLMHYANENNIKSTANSAVVQSFETSEEFNKLKESTVKKSSGRVASKSKFVKIDSEEIIKKLKEEIVLMQGTLISRESIIEQTERENIELKSQVNQIYEQKQLNLEFNTTDASCKCSVF